MFDSPSPFITCKTNKKTRILIISLQQQQLGLCHRSFPQGVSNGIKAFGINHSLGMPMKTVSEFISKVINACYYGNVATKTIYIICQCQFQYRNQKGYNDFVSFPGKISDTCQDAVLVFSFRGERCIIIVEQVLICHQ